MQGPGNRRPLRPVHCLYTVVALFPVALAAPTQRETDILIFHQTGSFKLYFYIKPARFVIFLFPVEMANGMMLLFARHTGQKSNLLPPVCPILLFIPKTGLIILKTMLPIQNAFSILCTWHRRTC